MAPSRYTFSADFLKDPESLPQLPPTFPRYQWLDHTHFGIPPYGPYQHVYAVAWAGRQASRTWSRCLNVETPDPDGLFTRDPQPEPADIVDRTCFKLAVFDKAFETLWHCGIEQANMIFGKPFTREEFLAEVDEIVDECYAIALFHLPSGSPPAPPLEEIRPFLRSALDAWSSVVEVKKTPAPVPGKPKRRGAPAGWVEPFAIDELGRFEAMYYTHRSDEYTWEGGEPEREIVVEHALPVPAEFWPVSQPQARRAPGPVLSLPLRRRGCYTRRLPR